MVSQNLFYINYLNFKISFCPFPKDSESALRPQLRGVEPHMSTSVLVTAAPVPKVCARTEMLLVKRTK